MSINLGDPSSVCKHVRGCVKIGEDEGVDYGRDAHAVIGPATIPTEDPLAMPYPGVVEYHIFF